MTISSDEENLEMYVFYRLVTTSVDSKPAIEAVKMAVLWFRNCNLGNCDGKSTSNGPNVFMHPADMPFDDVLWNEPWAGPLSNALGYGTDVSLPQAQTRGESVHQASPALATLWPLCKRGWQAGRGDPRITTHPPPTQCIADCKC